MATVLVTGATGLTGSNVCRLLVERGDDVRALVRSRADAQPLAGLGVEMVEGDIVDPRSVLAAADGAESAIHTAALLGGASQNPSVFAAVNLTGTVNVLDAAHQAGLTRVVAFSTGTFFDRDAVEHLEDAPLLDEPPTDPYTTTKLAAYQVVMERAAAGQDVLTCHPGAIYGPGPVIDRALARTSFNRVILAALRGRLRRSLGYPVSWVTGTDVARGAIAALDRGVAGHRYWLVGRAEDRASTAQACNRAIAIAGLSHEVVDIDPRDDREALVEEFGPTLVAVATRSVEDGERPRPSVSKTSAEIGYEPVPLDEGLTELVTWLRTIGRLD